VEAVAEGRKLDPSRVREFADGRVFSGAQAKDLGLVDELGDEERARVLAAQLADLDEERCRVVTLGKPRKPLLQGLSGSHLLARIQELVTVEMELSGQPLWLFRP
jgi:protease-4